MKNKTSKRITNLSGLLMLSVFVICVGLLCNSCTKNAPEKPIEKTQIQQLQAVTKDETGNTLDYSNVVIVK